MSTKMVKSCDLCAAVIEEPNHEETQSVQISVATQHPLVIPADKAAHFPNHTAHYRRDVCLTCAPPLLKILGMVLYQEGDPIGGVEEFESFYGPKVTP